jgi:hypothetical protein
MFLRVGARLRDSTAACDITKPVELQTVVASRRTIQRARTRHSSGGGRGFNWAGDDRLNLSPAPPHLDQTSGARVPDDAARW